VLAVMYLLVRREFFTASQAVVATVADGTSIPTLGIFDQATSQPVSTIEVATTVARSDALRAIVAETGGVFVALAAVSLALCWLVAGRALRPLRQITDTAAVLSHDTMDARIGLRGPRDEVRALADTFDEMLDRLARAFQGQRLFVANASHELRTPLAITRTLLDVARNDPHHDPGELVDRLRHVNTRAIDLTEALLLLSRADQRSFTPEHIDLSLIAEEATETLLPLAEQRGLTIETSGDATPTIGSPALLLQMATNLVHNAIVHNLPEHGTVWVTTSARPESVVLTVENTGEKLTPQLVATLAEPFQRGSKRIRTNHAGVGLGLAIVNSISQAHDGTLTLAPRPAGGLCVTVQLPAAPPRPADDRQGSCSGCPLPRVTR